MNTDRIEFKCAACKRESESVVFTVPAFTGRNGKWYIKMAQCANCNTVIFVDRERVYR